jgi:predicted transcriptional regulator
MRTVNIGVSSIEDEKTRAKAAFRGEYQGEFIAFPSIEAMWNVLTPRRWALIQTMAGKGPMSLRAVARMLGRDVKAVHGDMHALLVNGVLDRSEAGFEFPYDRIHVEFDLQGQAA